MDGEAGSGVELLVADVALEVFCLLVLQQDLLIIKVPVAVPAPRRQKKEKCETSFAALLDRVWSLSVFCV